MASAKKIFSGAALGILFGSLTALLFPKRHEIIEQVRNHSRQLTGLTEQAKEFGENLLNKGRQFKFQRIEYRDRYVKGGLIGLVVGTTVGLLLAPKPGKALRGQLTRAYNGISEKSDELIHQFSNNHLNGLQKRAKRQKGQRTKTTARAKKA